MMSNLHLRLAIIIAVLCCLLGTHGWSERRQWKPKPWDVNRRTAALLGCIALLAPIPIPPAIAASMEEQLRDSLKLPTADRPQIMLPDGDSSVSPENRPILEGLISLSNPQKRPVPTDTIVITFSRLDRPDTILGGARIPVTQARFPLAFRMFPKNVLPDRLEEWETAVKEGDLLVQAVLCPEDRPKCTPRDDGAGTDRMQAQGVAKLIRNLPGQLAGRTIRGPVALPLR